MMFVNLFRPKISKIYKNIDFSWNWLATLFWEITRFQPKTTYNFTTKILMCVKLEGSLSPIILKLCRQFVPNLCQFVPKFQNLCPNGSVPRDDPSNLTSSQRGNFLIWVLFNFQIHHSICYNLCQFVPEFEPSNPNGSRVMAILVPYISPFYISFKRREK